MATQHAGAAGGRNAAFAAHSAGNDEGPAPSTCSAAQGTHGRLQHGMHKAGSTAARATAAAAAAAAAAAPWPIEAPIEVKPWAAAPRHKYQPQTHDCRTVVGLMLPRASVRAGGR